MQRWLLPLIVCLLFWGWGTLSGYGISNDRSVSSSQPKNRTLVQEPPKEDLQIPEEILEEEGVLDSLTITPRPGKLKGSIFRHRVEHGEAYDKKALFTSLGIFIAVIATIIANRVEIAIVGMAGAVLMTLVGHYMGFYHPQEAFGAIDLATLGLILGMMIVTGLLEHSGFFQILAFFLATKCGRNPKLLLIVLGTVTALLSMVVNNVTMVLVVAPVTIKAADILKLNPVPFIMVEAMLATVGGTASLVGDPPNIMIGSAAHITFNNFFIHMAPIAFISAAVSYAIVIAIFWKELRYKGRHTALAKLPKIKVHAQSINTKEIIILLSCLGVVIILFILESILHLDPSFITLIGASLALVLVQPDIERLLAHIEWSVILFYASLFVCVGGLEKAGVLHFAASQVVIFTQANMIIAVLVIAWFAALMSMVVENSVLTLALIPVFLHLKDAGVNITPLWWALAMGVTFGGNATPIGATTNIIVMFLSKKTKHPITFGYWMKVGMPLTFAIVTIGSGLIIAFAKFYSY
ncbi:MAG: SLC13 family permease [Candidatus Brocadiales bacterium]